MQSNNQTAKTGQKRADLITSLILLAFSAFIIINAFSMSIYMQYAPGPGMFPLVLGIVLAILSVSLLISAVSPKGKDKESPFSNKQAMLPALLLALGLIAYAALLSTLGYIIDTFLLVLYIMLIISKDKPKTAILTAVIITAMVALIFQVGLQLRLPHGIFGI